MMQLPHPDKKKQPKLNWTSLLCWDKYTSLHTLFQHARQIQVSKFIMKPLKSLPGFQLQGVLRQQQYTTFWNMDNKDNILGNSKTKCVLSPRKKNAA